MEPKNKETRFDKRRFRDLYHESLEDVFHYWTPGMQDEIARHCYPWRNGTTDFKNYLSAVMRSHAIHCTGPVHFIPSAISADSLAFSPSHWLVWDIASR